MSESRSVSRNARAVPYHCPYCGDTDLFPAEKGWECRACLRAFTVTMLGMIRPSGDVGRP